MLKWREKRALLTLRLNEEMINSNESISPTVKPDTRKMTYTKLEYLFT